MEKKKARFNIVDAIVIAVILCAAALVGYKVIGGGMSGRNESTYEMKFMCEEVPEFAASIIQEGDKVVDEQKDVPLGEVTAVKLGDSRTYTTDSQGVVHCQPKPYYNSVELTTTLKAGDYDNGVIVGSSKYGVGHSITIRAGKAKIFGRVSQIKKISDEK